MLDRPRMYIPLGCCVMYRNIIDMKDPDQKRNFFPRLCSKSVQKERGVPRCFVWSFLGGNPKIRKGTSNNEMAFYFSINKI